MEYLTLIEAAKLQQTPLQRGVIEIFPRVSPVLERLPFFPVNGMAYVYNQEETLPGVAFRGINESYTADTGVVNPAVERLFIFGGISQYDRALVKTQGNVNNLRAVHDAMKAKAEALLFTRTFFKGNNTVNGKEWDGLENRLSGAQVIDNGCNDFSLACLDRTIDAVQGSPDVIFCNKIMRREISAAVRAAGQAIETVTGAFGQQLPAYAGIPIAVIEDDNEGNEILGFTEGCCSTSIYVVRFGIKEYVCGLQAGAMDVEDLGANGIFLETLIEWIAGLGVFHPKAAARYRHITMSDKVCEDDTCSTTSTTSSTSSTTSSTTA